MTSLATSKKNTEHFNVTQHPLIGCTLKNWIHLLIKNKGISNEYWLKFLFISISSLTQAPFRLVETLALEKSLTAVKFQQDPIFILGHWRSGTTHLHRLFVQDPQFGYVTSLQTFLPESCKTAGSIMSKIWPESRVIDNMAYSPNVPEEEEYAVANLLPLSYYQGLFFPQNIQQCFKESVLLEGLSEEKIDQWKETLVNTLKKTALLSSEKQLIIKNPANTARIPTLLSLFPNAKFIHIVRNPYDVFSSMRLFYGKLLPQYALQSFHTIDIDELILDFYSQLYGHFNETVHEIPAENFVEVRYEDLVGHELETLKRVYHELGLQGFGQAKPALEAYLHSLKSYRKNRHELDDNTKKIVFEKWNFAFEKWGYARVL